MNLHLLTASLFLEAPPLPSRFPTLFREQKPDGNTWTATIDLVLSPMPEFPCCSPIQLSFGSRAIGSSSGDQCWCLGSERKLQSCSPSILACLDLWICPWYLGLSQFLWLNLTWAVSCLEIHECHSHKRGGYQFCFPKASLLPKFLFKCHSRNNSCIIWQCLKTFVIVNSISI